MSQLANSVGGDSFVPKSPPEFLVRSNPQNDAIPENALRITLPSDDVAKIEAFRAKRVGLPRTSSRAFRELRERLLKEMEAKS